MSTNTNTDGGKGALTETEARALVAEAARLGVDALRAVGALLAVGAVLALAVLMAAGVRSHDERASSALTGARSAPYGNTAP